MVPPRSRRGGILRLEPCVQQQTDYASLSMEQIDTTFTAIRATLNRLQCTSDWWLDMPPILIDSASYRDLVADLEAEPAPSTDDLIDLVPTTLDEDRKQDTILALLEQRPSTLVEAQTIVRRVGWVHDRARHAAKRRTLPIEGDLVAEQPDRQRLGDMYSVIDTLPDSDREILTLAYVESLSDTAIAARIGISVRTVYRRKASALAAAREAARGMFPDRSGTE